MGENDLSNVQNDALTANILSKNGVETQLPFSRDIFLMKVKTDWHNPVRNIYQLAKELQVGERVTFHLDPENYDDNTAVLILDARNKKLGYLPIDIKEVPYHLLVAGKELYGIIQGGDIGEDLNQKDQRIEINIDMYMRD